MKLFKISSINGSKSECEVETESEVKFLTSNGWKFVDDDINNIDDNKGIGEDNSQTNESKQPKLREIDIVKARCDELGIPHNRYSKVANLKKKIAEFEVNHSEPEQTGETNDDIDIDL